MSFPAYPQYQESGHDWLGHIPSHWRMVPLKHLCRFEGGGTPDKDRLEYWNGDVPWVSPKDMGVEYIDRTQDHITREAVRGSATNMIPANSILIVARSGILRKTIPVAVTRRDVSLNQDMKALIALDDPVYVMRIIQSHPSALLVKWRKQGATVESLEHERVANSEIPMPPPDEREQILSFLDHETARIDALIEEQQRLIKLLREKRQGVVDHAISRGLSHDAPLTASGIDDLGEIPSHWEIKRLWHLTPRHRRIMYGIVLPGPHYEGGIPIVKGGDVAEHRLKLNELSRTTPKIECKYERSRLRTGDLVYSIRGSIGEVAKIPAELDGANLTQDAARVAYTESTDGGWLLFALQANPIFGQLESKAVGATIRGINIRDLKRALIPVPPLDEQRQIAEFLKRRISEFQRLEDEAARAISLMTEHRSSLISSAVTGKIDVRSWDRSKSTTEEALPQVAEEEGRYG